MTVVTAIENQRRKRLRTKDRQAEIISTSIRIIAREGLREFKAARLAREEGITSGAIFKHFDSMNQIVDGVVEHIESLLFSNFFPACDAPLSCLQAFFLQRIRVIREHPDVSRLLLADHLAASTAFPALARLTEFRKRSGGYVRRCLRDAKKQGQLGNTVSVEDGATLVLGAIFAISHSHTTPMTAKQMDKTSARIWSVLQYVLTGQGPDVQEGVKQ